MRSRAHGGDDHLPSPTRLTLLAALGAVWVARTPASPVELLPELFAGRPKDGQEPLRITKGLTLGAETELLTWWPRVVVGDGVHLFMISASAELPFRVDASGWGARTIGRAGAGPGEFRRPGALALDSSGRLHVYDAKLGRRQVLDADLRLVSSTTIGPYVISQALVLPDGTTALCTWTHRPDIVEPTLRLLPIDGRGLLPVQSSATASLHSDERWRAARVLGPSLSGGFWAGHRYRTQVDRYDAQGRHLTTLACASARFITPRLSRSQPDVAVLGEPALGSMLVGLWEEPSDRLVLVYLVPTGVRFEKDSRWKIFRTIVEVIDVRRGRSRAATEVAEEAMSVVRPRSIAGYSELGDGEPQVTLYDIALPAS